MQGVVPDDALHVRVFCGAVKPDFQPFRFFQDVYLLFMQFRHFKFIIFPIDAKIQKILKVSAVHVRIGFMEEDIDGEYCKAGIADDFQY